MRQFLYGIVFVALLAGPALADDTVGEISAAAAKAQNGRSAENGGRVPIATSLVEAKPARQPIYVENWARLFELTQSDPVVSARADRLTSRWETTVGTTLELLGLSGAVAMFGTFDRLANDHWTNTAKWTLASGLSVAIATLIVAWAISPDRTDFLEVINQWNVRHPDRPLAP